MNVSLTTELESWILERVESGLYRSSSEVVREALRLLREQDELKTLRLEELRKLVQAGLDDVYAARVLDLTPDLAASIKERGRRRLEGNHSE